MSIDAPQLLGPGEGETIRPGFEIKVGRPELVLTEAVYAPGAAGPDPHVHHDHADAFWVFEGELQFGIGPELEVRTLGAGEFALVPPDVLHTFRNASTERARFLNLHSPGCAFEEYLRSGFKTPFDQWYEPPGTGRPGSEAISLGPGGGERLEFEASSALVKASVSDALGSFALLELELAPGSPGPAPHHHEQMVASFYVLDGTLSLRLGGEDLSAPAGSYAVVPPGNAHTFSNPGPDPVRILSLMAPAPKDDFIPLASR